ncbi:3-ketodihydrosphingosine reductase [Leptinotarsa decemlineata]|uniref:3-ketodihydrosphingosine reductase n=1 Tax=Leptinotarsa decemlineata TaxID=7539 RepID=UPI003D30746F
MIGFIIILVITILFLVLKYFKSPHKSSLKGRHIVVTGGSSGIGKWVAILGAKRGAHVTIIARNADKLEDAQKEIKTFCINEEQKITKVSVDVSKYGDIQHIFHELEETVGPIFMLVNCAGIAICGKLEDFDEQQIKQLIDVNFLGTLYPVKAIIPKFKERKEGIVVLTASQVALMGMYGYSVYSSCKFALRGLAESLQMEVKPYNISVTLALPPDTDTPGFELENQTKPIETKLISEVAGLAKPEQVARNLIDDALAHRFFSYSGFESYILTTLCVGMSPFTSFLDVIVQAVLLGPLRLLSVYYILSFNYIVKKCHLEKMNK